MQKKTSIQLFLVFGGFIVATAAFISVVYGGFYNVAAVEGHTKPVEWVLRTTMENSIRNHAKNIEVPDTIDLDDPIFSREFYGHYNAACKTCHGAPGQKADPWMVIYPEAPELTRKEVVAQWTDAELFWILKYGIKDTGMMALGPTHTDSDIWGVTALVRQLPDMTPEAYQAMADWYNGINENKNHKH